MANDLYSANQFHKISFGDYGFRILTNGDTSVSGEYFSTIQVLTDCTISLTSGASGGDSSITNLDLDEGQIIYGNLTSISLSKGDVIAYLR